MSDEAITCEALKLTVSDPRTLVLMMDSPEPRVCAQACDALQAYAEQGAKQKTELLKLNAVKSLVQVLRSADASVRKAGAACIATMTENADVGAELRQLGGIGSLIALLGAGEESETHENAAMALVSLSADYSAKAEIFSAGGFAVLIPLLSAPDPDVQKNVSTVVRLMLDDYNCRAVVNEQGGIPPLLELVASEYSEIQEQALQALALIALDAENRAAIRQLGGLMKLVEAMDGQGDELHVEVLAVVANCLEDPDSVVQLQEMGGLSTLVKLLTETGDNKVQEQCALALGRAARNEVSRAILGESGVIEALVELLGTSDTDASALSAAAQAVASLAGHSVNSALVGKVEGLSVLLGLLTHADMGVREGALLALAQCSQHPENRGRLVKLDAVSPLVSLLGVADRPSAQSSAAICLANIGKDIPTRAALRAAGGIKALVGAMQSPSQAVQSQAALTLAECVCEAEGRSELVEVGGIAPLVALLESPSAAVRKAAAWATTCCADHITAKVICAQGGLDALRRLASKASGASLVSTTGDDSSAMGGAAGDSGFVQAALDAVLDRYLPAKYWCAGVISPAQRIGDGFFDSGAARPGAPFQLLDTLCEQRLKKGRATLVVDSGEDAELAEAANEILTQLKGVTEVREQVEALANFVATRMGGPVSAGKLQSFSVEMPLSKLMMKLQSNVVPIGMVRAGTFYHRALLFKVLADRLGLPCSLARGEYTRAWNTVLLGSGAAGGSAVKQGLLEYVVDLMHEPGKLLRVGSPEAARYRKL